MADATDTNETPKEDIQVEGLTINQSTDLNEEDAKEYYKLLFPENTIDDLTEALKRESDKLGPAEFTRQLNKVGSFIDCLKRMVDSHTQQTEYIFEALGRLKDLTKIGEAYDYQADPENPEDQPFALKNRVLRLDKSLKGVEVSGQQAKMLILAANNNIKKIYLYNSGFNIVLRGPTLLEINLVYNRLSEEMGEYGRMLGAIFYMYSDFKIKSILWDFIYSLVINTNLNKYDKGNRLRDSISLLDYQTILLGIGSLMFKNGYQFVHVCTNPDCRYHTTETIDLSLLQLTDFSRITDDKLRWLSSNDVVNPEDLRTYRKELKLNTTCTIGKYKIHRKIPSMTDYLTHGTAYNDELAMSIHDIRDPKIIDQYLKFNYSRLFEPWISFIEVLDDQGEVSFKVTDRENVTLILNEIQNSDDRDDFTKQMNEYIQDSSITNTGYLATACESCGQMPTGLVNGFVPFDAQNAFFTMLVMRLIQTS